MPSEFRAQMLLLRELQTYPQLVLFIFDLNYYNVYCLRIKLTKIKSTVSNFVIRKNIKKHSIHSLHEYKDVGLYAEYLHLSQNSHL